ncbi:hypothetical protein NUACC26_050900 [Scytonema sp. NUACC26]
MGGGLESTDLITDSNGNLISNYIYAGGSSPLMRIGADGTHVYYLTDTIGTVIGLTDGSGASKGKFLYDAFGNILSLVGGNNSAAGGDFRFQGQWLESESGLYHLRARDYDPATGLFLSRDRVDIIEMVPESFNPYQFVYNNPYIYSDPTGMITITEISASQYLEKSMNALRTYGMNQARDRLRQKASDAIGNVALEALKAFIPYGDSFPMVFKDALQAGRWFEDMFRDTICEMLPFDTSQLFLEVGVRQNGQPYSPGFTCGVYSLPTRERDELIGFFSGLGAQKDTARPDFIVTPPGSKPRESRDNGRTLVFGGPRPSWVIGDIKLSIKTLYNDYVGSTKYAAKKPNQWNANLNYAAKNGFNVAGFITLFGEGKKFDFYRHKIIEKALQPREGRFGNLGVGLLIATISQGSSSPFK